jgi:hypothetical protein
MAAQSDLVEIVPTLKQIVCVKDRFSTWLATV